jgi:hypothetical protein
MNLRDEPLAHLGRVLEFLLAEGCPAPIRRGLK